MSRVAIFSSSMGDFLMHIVLEFNVGGKKKISLLFIYIVMFDDRNRYEWSCLIVSLTCSMRIKCVDMS